jgi:hypothetical protein
MCRGTWNCFNIKITYALNVTGEIVAIDDELEKSALAAEIRDESERTIQEMLVKSGIAGTISLIPLGVGPHQRNAGSIGGSPYLSANG